MRILPSLGAFRLCEVVRGGITDLVEGICLEPLGLRRSLTWWCSQVANCKLG
jgi:hypothetical protein